MTANTLEKARLVKQNTDVSQRQAAMTAGLGLLIMAFLAFFANFFVLESVNKHFISISKEKK